MVIKPEREALQKPKGSEEKEDYSIQRKSWERENWVEIKASKRMERNVLAS